MEILTSLQIYMVGCYDANLGTSGDSPQCGEMSRSDKGEGHVLSAPAPTICLLFVKSFVGDGVLDVPKLVFQQTQAQI